MVMGPGRCSNELDRDRSNRKAPREWRLRRRPHQLSNRPVGDFARAAGKGVGMFPPVGIRKANTQLATFPLPERGGKLGHGKNTYHGIFDRARADVGPAARGAGAPGGPACP